MFEKYNYEINTFVFFGFILKIKLRYTHSTLKRGVKVVVWFARMSEPDDCSQGSATQQEPPTKDGKDESQMTYDDIQKACSGNPDLLLELVSRNYTMFENMMEKSRRQRTMMDDMTLDQAAFVQEEHTDKACYIFSEAIGSVFRDFVLSDPKRKELMVDIDTREHAKDLLVRLHDFKTEFADLFQTAFDEAMQPYCEDFKTNFIDKYYSVYNEEKEDFETAIIEAPPNQESEKENPEKEEEPPQDPAMESPIAKSTPSKRPLVRLSSAGVSSPRSGILEDSSSDEDEEEGEEEDFAPREILYDENNNKDPDRTPSQASPKPKKRKFSPEKQTSKKTNRGRPRKGPSMDLTQGMRVLAFNTEVEEWSAFKIGPRASNTVITITAAKKLLSAGHLKPEYVDV